MTNLVTKLINDCSPAWAGKLTDDFDDNHLNRQAHPILQAYG